MDKKKLFLYAITNSTITKNNPTKASLSKAIEEASRAGITMLQLREKELSDADFLHLAKEIKQITDAYNIPLILNDRVHLVKECGAYGVHLGASDTPIKEARKFLGNDYIIGASARTLEQALKAQDLGADYLGIGDIFGTSTKKDAKRVSYAIMKTICTNIKIPAVAIGGITAENIKFLSGSGISGIAVISAIFASTDIPSSVKELNAELQKIIKC